MEFAKKNVLNLVCAGITLIAIIALFWPLAGMYAFTQGELNKQRELGESLSRLRVAQRTWPTIPDSKTPPVKLEHFPSQDVIAQGKEMQEAIKQQAIAMQDEAERINVHEQLVTDVLPLPGERRFEFERAYRKLVEQTYPADLGATSPPTDVDIKAAANELWNNTYQPKIITVAGKPVNAQQVLADWQEACGKLPESLRAERAAKGRVYVNPGALAVSHEVLTNPSATQGTQIWLAQNMVWIENDVIAAINRANQGSHNVMESPVKQIVRLDIPEDMTQYVMPAAAGPSGAAQTSTPAVGKAFNRTPTGRVSNSLYDVLQFTLTVDVDARKIPALLAELQRGKLITVTQYDLNAIDAQSAAEEGYIYGDVAVAQVVIHGEEVFLRDWTTRLMPDDIKTRLQIVAAK